jgi:Spy/CpxP family protein refolding chaperone
MPSKMSDEKSKTSKMSTGAVVIVAVVLVAGSILAVGCARHRFCNMSPERITGIVFHGLGDALDDLDATEAQRREINAIAKEVLREGLALREKHRAHRGRFLAELKKGEPNRQLFHDKIDEKVTELEEFAHFAVDKLLDAYLVLDPEQREVVLERIEDHHEKCASN